MPPRRRIPATIRRQLAEQAGYRCSYCRSPEVVGIPMVVDHIIPLAAEHAHETANPSIPPIRVLLAQPLESLTPLSISGAFLLFCSQS